MIFALMLVALVGDPGKNYKDDANSAIRESLKSRRPLVLIVTSKDCVPCKQTKLMIEKIDRLGKIKGFNLALIDIESELGKRVYRGAGVPQIDRYEFVDDAWYRKKKLGYLPQDKFLEFAHGKKN